MRIVSDLVQTRHELQKDQREDYRSGSQILINDLLANRPASAHPPASAEDFFKEYWDKQKACQPSFIDFTIRSHVRNIWKKFNVHSSFTQPPEVLKPTPFIQSSQ